MKDNRNNQDEFENDSLNRFDDSDMRIVPEDQTDNQPEFPEEDQWAFLFEKKADIEVSEEEPLSEEIQEENAENSEEPISEDNNATKNFAPVSSEEIPETSGATKTFESISPDEKKKREEAQKQEPLNNDNAKTVKAAAMTFSAVMGVFRKILTYTLNVVLTILVVGMITGVVVVGAFMIYIKNYVDPTYDGLDNLKFDSSLSTTMYYVDADGKEVLLENDTLAGSENRLWADYEDIPKYLIDAYIAVEDQRFWEHDGVDTTRTASAIYNFFIPTSSNYGGGSTITQQLIKNDSGENAATIQRKVQEIFRAFYVEDKFTKEEILEMYLNTIFLSHNSYGVRVAANTYFGKDLNELTLAECASIASIGKWPTHYDPISNPKNNLTRRNLVLKLMLEQGKITQEEFDAAYDAPITLKNGADGDNYTETIHSYYIDAVMDDVIADLMAEYGYDKTTASKVLYSGGLQIVTCLDPAIQACAEKVFTDSSYWPETSGMQAQSAMCIMDPKTGDLKAIVGGLGEKRESRGLNRATHSYRQCGSSIKPVSVYALAIENGLIHSGSPVDDVPPVYYEDSKTYWPKNSNSKYQGIVSADYALQASLNTIAVAYCDKLGVDNVFASMKGYGYSTLVDSMTTANGTVLSDRGLSSMALGGMTYGVTVREHTQAYATLANDGITSKARTYSLVRDNAGRIILDNNEKHDVKYSQSTAELLTEMLTHVVSGSYGTARKYITFGSEYGVTVAGKTGTTNDKKDVYFSGYTPDLVACCWYGYDNNKIITTSGNCAAMLWNSVFEEIYSYYKANGIEYTKKFDSDIVYKEVCTISGKLPTAACRNDFYDDHCDGMNCIQSLPFIRDEVPTESCDKHIMLKWDQKTKSLCLDGCECPEDDLKEYGFRIMTLADRALYAPVKILDAEGIYMEVPEGYVYPTDPNVPFFQNALPEGVSFGYSSSGGKPGNRVCLKHLKKEEDPPEDPIDPENPVDPENPEDPADPENPEDPVDPENPADPQNPTDPENPPTDPTTPETPQE